MRILVSWLREYVTFDVSVQELADALTMRGLEVSAIVPPPPGVGGTGEDAVLDLEITTNRPDCLSVFGIAREMSTIYDTPLRAPDCGGDSNTGGESAVEVTLEDVGLCPRYAASVANVTVDPSPGWLAARLDAAGIRPINNVVDVTNYVMLELGHPTHAFDLDRLDGRALRIRRAVAGEKIRTLDGLERTLQTDMLVIADASRPQAVAGVMGGADAEVSGGTRAVAIESAYFEPTSVRRTSKRLGLSTDASYRFERGTDIGAPVAALRRVYTLLTQIGAAQPNGPIIDHYRQAREPRVVELRHQRIARVLGITIDEGFVVTTLERLGFAVQPADAPHEGTRWRITVPTYRIDVSREIDLIEEVARHHGYDRLPSTFPALVQAPTPTGRWLKRQRLLRRILTASGCSEAITYSFIEQEAAAPFATDSGNAKAGTDIVTIANPLSEKFAVLRPSLLPGLIDALIRNRRREPQDVRLFEIGKHFSQRGGETAAVGPRGDRRRRTRTLERDRPGSRSVRCQGDRRASVRRARRDPDVRTDAAARPRARPRRDGPRDDTRRPRHRAGAPGPTRAIACDRPRAPRCEWCDLRCGAGSRCAGRRRCRPRRPTGGAGAALPVDRARRGDRRC